MKTDNIQLNDHSDSLKTLDGQTVISVGATLCGIDPAAAEKLQKGFLRLVSAENWASEVVCLERLGLTARYHSGPLREALDLPGDLVLLRNRESRFMLLSSLENRWQYLQSRQLLKRLPDRP